MFQRNKRDFKNTFEFRITLMHRELTDQQHRDELIRLKDRIHEALYDYSARTRKDLALEVLNEPDPDKEPSPEIEEDLFS